MKKQNVVIVLADGFEEIEALTPMDVLRRLGCDVCLAGLSGEIVQGAHGLCVKADKRFEEVNFSSADAIVLPGGLPGAVNLRNHSGLRKELQKAAAEGRITAAICAAPIVLQDAGLLKYGFYTGYPGSEKLAESAGMHYTESLTERTGSIITAKGPGAAFAFSREIALALGCSESEFSLLEKAMIMEKE